MIQTEKGFAPSRMCAACRKRDAKQNLLRIVQDGGAIQIDLEQTSQCRGVYFCKSEECIQKAKKTKTLSHVFKRQVDDAIYTELSKSVGEQH